MKERPILFNGEMVRALLDGRKSQTRRVVKPQPKHMPIRASADNILYDADCINPGIPIKEPFVVGQRLWVRETWRPVGPWECRKDGATAQYCADKSYLRKLGWPEDYRIKTFERRDKWKPSIFMPRWASRLTLEITAVRVERVQSITEADALAEGVTIKPSAGIASNVCQGTPGPAQFEYYALWESINGKKHPWKGNPFCWVVFFKRIK